MNIVADEADDEDHDDLDEDQDDRRPQQVAVEQRIDRQQRGHLQALHPHVERRRGGVDDVGDRRAGHVERHLQRAARHPLVAGDGEHDGALRRHDADLLASGHPDAVEVERVDARRRRGGEVGQRRRVRRQHGPVVQLPRQHQPIVVADAVGGARHRPGQGGRVDGSGTASTPSVAACSAARVAARVGGHAGGDGVGDRRRPT